MSRATITLPNDLLEELLGAVEAKSKTDAVVKAIRDKIKLSKIEKIKQMAGRMEFVQTAEEIRHGDKRLG
jgi:metal-responsive CopG/Arc/MetJ family transcriptional regulator